MSDIREDALARMLAILQAIAGIKTATRNRDQFPQGARPAVNLFDGDEQLSQDVMAQPSALVGAATVPMHMQPVVNLLIGDVPGAVGTQVNQFRALIINKVQTDAQLQTILKAGPRGRSSGFVQYIGCQTRFSHSLAMDCDLQLNFLLGYQLNPADL